MASVTVDLPAELLEEVGRLAQQMNVPRTDVYRLAVLAYARSLAQELELAEARSARAAAARDRQVSDRAARAQRAVILSLSRELEAVRGERDVAVRQARGATLEARRMAADLAGARDSAREAHRLREAAERAAADLAERDRQKVLAVMRDQEVAALRRRHQDVSVAVQKLEQELVYQKMDADLKARKITGLERQLAATTRQKTEFEAGFKREQKETFKSERQIGRLLQERARLRDELKRLAGMMTRSARVPAPPPGVPRPADANPGTGASVRPKQVQSKS